MSRLHIGRQMVKPLEQCAGLREDDPEGEILFCQIGTGRPFFSFRYSSTHFPRFMARPVLFFGS